MYQIFEIKGLLFFFFNLIEPLTIKVSTAVSIQICLASLFASSFQQQATDQVWQKQHSHRNFCGNCEV